MGLFSFKNFCAALYYISVQLFALERITKSRLRFVFGNMREIINSVLVNDEFGVPCKRNASYIMETFECIIFMPFTEVFSGDWLCM